MARVGAATDARGLEQLRVGRVHRARSGEGRQIGGALRAVAHAQPARYRPEHQRAEGDGEQAAEQEQRDLPARMAAGGLPRRAAPARRRRAGGGGSLLAPWQRAETGEPGHRGPPRRAGRERRHDRALAGAERVEREFAERGLDLRRQDDDRQVELREQRLERRWPRAGHRDDDRPSAIARHRCT